MEKKFDDNDEIQIDLLELAYALKKKLWLIILGLIVGAFGAGLYSKILLTPIYKSTAMVYVLSKETTLTSLADLQIGSQLTKDYSVLVTFRSFREIFLLQSGGFTSIMQSGVRGKGNHEQKRTEPLFKKKT